MVSARSISVLSLLATAGLVSAHGHVEEIYVDGTVYPNFAPQSDPWQSPPPVRPGWTADNTDNGFVDSNAYSSPAIICHKDGKNGKGFIPVSAGSDVTFKWNTWPSGHSGAVMTYMAPCHGKCDTVDPASLNFFKIDELGKKDGVFGTDLLLQNGLTWTVNIPSSIAAGDYVVRHELLALHSAFDMGQAQNYPQCVNFRVSGSGSTVPDGKPATQFYKASDPGVHYNLYASSPADYVIPGPALIAGAKSVEQRAVPKPGSSGSCTSYSNSGDAPVSDVPDKVAGEQPSTTTPPPVKGDDKKNKDKKNTTTTITSTTTILTTITKSKDAPTPTPTSNGREHWRPQEKAPKDNCSSKKTKRSFRG